MNFQYHFKITQVKVLPLWSIIRLCQFAVRFRFQPLFQPWPSGRGPRVHFIACSDHPA